MESLDKILDKCIAYGEIVITAEDMEVSIESLYTIEDDAYHYIYCPLIGVFAYGGDIKTAEDNIVSAIWVNFEALHNENRVADIYDNPLDEVYSQAIKELEIRHNKQHLKIIAESYLNPENTENFRTPKKGAQLYDLSTQIKMKVYSELVSVKKSA